MKLQFTSQYANEPFIVNFRDDILMKIPYFAGLINGKFEEYHDIVEVGCSYQDFMNIIFLLTNNQDTDIVNFYNCCNYFCCAELLLSDSFIDNNFMMLYDKTNIIELMIANDKKNKLAKFVCLNKDLDKILTEIFIDDKMFHYNGELTRFGFCTKLEAYVRNKQVKESIDLIKKGCSSRSAFAYAVNGNLESVVDQFLDSGFIVDNGLVDMCFSTNNKWLILKMNKLGLCNNTHLVKCIDSCYYEGVIELINNGLGTNDIFIDGVVTLLSILTSAHKKHYKTLIDMLNLLFEKIIFNEHFNEKYVKIFCLSVSTKTDYYIKIYELFEKDIMKITDIHEYFNMLIANNSFEIPQRMLDYDFLIDEENKFKSNTVPSYEQSLLTYLLEAKQYELMLKLINKRCDLKYDDNNLRMLIDNDMENVAIKLIDDHICVNFNIKDYKAVIHMAIEKKMNRFIEKFNEMIQNEINTC